MACAHNCRVAIGFHMGGFRNATWVAGMSEQTTNRILSLGYYRARQLPRGHWLALLTNLFTTGLCVVDEPTLSDAWSNGLRTRFCYQHSGDAEAAFEIWDGQGDPPGPWIKQKPEDRMNPAWLAEARQEMVRNRD